MHDIFLLARTVCFNHPSTLSSGCHLCTVSSFPSMVTLSYKCQYPGEYFIYFPRRHLSFPFLPTSWKFHSRELLPSPSYIFSPGNIFSSTDALTYYISFPRKSSLLIPEHFIHSFFREHLIYPLSLNIIYFSTGNILCTCLSISYIFSPGNIFSTPYPISYIFLLEPSSLSIPQNSLHFPSRENLHYLSLTISHFPSRKLLLSSLLLIPNILIM
jgi:hypothetical protein